MIFSTLLAVAAIAIGTLSGLAALYVLFLACGRNMGWAARIVGGLLIAILVLVAYVLIGTSILTLSR